jgi:hypothetical protein
MVDAASWVSTNLYDLSALPAVHDNLKPTTIRFTEADEQVLEKLKGHTGCAQSLKS